MSTKTTVKGNQKPQNGTVKRITTANTAKVIKKVEEKAPAKETPAVKAQEVIAPVATPVIEIKALTLEDRLSSFEKLKGLTAQRERLVGTLDELNKFKYQNADSSVFHLKDENGQEFKTTNNNLIKLVTDVLQEQLTTRKNEIEKDILEFPM